MGSPLVFGGFNGWTVVGDSLSYTVGRAEYDDFLVRGSLAAADAVLTTGVLTGAFSVGDPISLTFSSSALDSITIACLDSGGSVVASTTATISSTGVDLVVSLVTVSGTEKVRITISGEGDSLISNIEIPGLEVASGYSGLPSTNGLPSFWEPANDAYAFSYAPGVDSGDGNGSIAATSTASGGSGYIETHAFSSVDPNRFYSYRISAALGSYANQHHDVFDAGGVQIGGGAADDPNSDGSWMEYGFMLPAEASYMRIFAHGAPSSTLYHDALLLPPPPAPASVDVDITAASPILESSGSEPGAIAELTAPQPTLSIRCGAHINSVGGAPYVRAFGGASASVPAPPPRLLSIARDSTGDYAASLTAPRPTLTAFGAATARATAPKPTLASGGTVVAMGSASVASPSVLVQSEGRASAMVRADLRAQSASLIGYGGAVVSVTLSGKATVEASGTTGGIAGASLECPLFQLSAEATAQNYGSASLIAPSPEIGRTVQAWVAAPAARLTAIGTAVVTATFDAYVVNLLHRGGSTVDEVTHYTNFPFTHVVRYQNSYYGMNSTGLYLLEGTTDDGDPIEWSVQTAMEDFGSPRRKTIDSVYIEGRLGAATTVSLQSGEKTPNTYSHTTPRGATAQNHRQKLGRGVKERYHALGLAGDGEFELDAVEFNERETNRRI